MKLKIIVLLIISHLIVGVIGFGAGIYALPILTAPDAPTNDQVATASIGMVYQAEFTRELKDSDALHWGVGKVSISADVITFQGELAPGPNYKLYLSPTFVETETEFEKLKSTMVEVGNVDTFNNFIVKLNSEVNPENYTSVIVWCESFGEFITAAQYR